jgi:hypothetical protein
MIENAHEIITVKLKLDPKNVTLVSGGAAFSDHVALILFLTKGYGKLNLYLPLPEPAAGRKGNGEVEEEEKEKYGRVQQPINWLANDEGKRSRQLHIAFSRILKMDTLHDIELARQKGAVIFYHNTFAKRNEQVANSTHMIAYTFSTTGAPPMSKSGTRQTWNMWEKRQSSTAKNHETNLGQRFHVYPPSLVKNH